jgi:hypothetical protein
MRAATSDAESAAAVLCKCGTSRLIFVNHNDFSGLWSPSAASRKKKFAAVQTMVAQPTTQADWVIL